METGKCPYCGESNYTVMYGISTAVYYPTRIVNGVAIRNDLNKVTYKCHCRHCGEEFDFTPERSDGN